MDNVNAGVNSAEVGYEFYLKAKRTFAEGGFNLRKFRSNSREFNPFLTNVPILYPLKTPENQRFSGVFRGYKMETLARNGSNR